MQDEHQEKADQAEWVIHLDGSSTNSEMGGGVMLITQKKSKLEYVIRFGFKATDNESEYESMITGLHLAYILGTRSVKVHSDS